MYPPSTVLRRSPAMRRSVCAIGMGGGGGGGFFLLLFFFFFFFMFWSVVFFFFVLFLFFFGGVFSFWGGNESSMVAVKVSKHHRIDFGGPVTAFSAAAKAAYVRRIIEVESNEPR